MKIWSASCLSVRRTGVRTDMRKLLVAFRNFANAHKKRHKHDDNLRYVCSLSSPKYESWRNIGDDVRWAHTRHVQGHGQCTAKEVNEIPYVRHSKQTSQETSGSLLCHCRTACRNYVNSSFFFFYGDGGSRLDTDPVIPISVTTES